MSKAKVTGFSSIDAEDESLRERHVNQIDADDGNTQDGQLNALDELEKEHRAKKSRTFIMLAITRDVIGPVSYTHLDVYKRQQPCRHPVYDETSSTKSRGKIDPKDR